MAKRIAVAALLIIGILALYVAFGTDAPAKVLREGITESIDEDFKIKESLGKVFFAKQDRDSVAVAGSAEIVAFEYPVGGEVRVREKMGESFLEFDCKHFEGVGAVYDGTVEECENGRITLRHYDGKLSVYSGVGALCRRGQKVCKGEIIGYARENITYRLYENCIALEPSGYFA